MIQNTTVSLIILGSGPAGLTAAIYAARMGVKTVLFEGSLPGGQLVQTSYVENWPGEKKILGPILMHNLREHAASYGTQFSTQSATSFDLKNTPFTVYTSTQILTCQSLIIATGSTANRLNCPGEHEYWGKGVSTCAVCDGALYENKTVIIVGGGDSAIEKATFMAQRNDVIIIHHQSNLSASPAMQQRVINHPRIRILYNHTVTQIDGNDKTMSSVVALNKKTNKAVTIQAHALFLAIGSRPNTDLCIDKLHMKPSGHIVVKHPSTATSITGVFACGDVIDPQYRQAITASASGCVAALDAIAFLQKNMLKNS